MNKIVNNFFVCLFVTALCSCAGMQSGNSSSENNLSASQTGKSESQINKGGFHPGIFIGNRIRDAKTALDKLANPPAKEPENSEQEVLMAKKEKVGLIEKNPREPIANGGIASNSKVYIKAGEYKRKYVLIEKERRKR